MATLRNELAALINAVPLGDFRDFAPLLNPETLEAIAVAIHFPRIQSYHKTLFGNKQPTQRRLHTWLRDHAGQEFASDTKPVVAQAVNHFATDLRLKLIFATAMGNAVECRLSTTREVPEPYARKFRVVSAEGEPLYQKYAFPLLDIIPG